MQVQPLLYPPETKTKKCPDRESNPRSSHPLFFVPVHVDHALLHVQLHGVVDGPGVHVFIADRVTRIAPPTAL